MWKLNGKKLDGEVEKVLTLQANTSNIEKVGNTKKLKIELLYEDTFALPYIRFFDSRDEIVEWEEKRGSILKEEDTQAGILHFETTIPLMKDIFYSVGDAIQINMEKETLKSPELLAFMKACHFDSTGDVTEHGMILFTTTEDGPKTATAFSVVDNEKIGFPVSCLCFKMKHPVLETFDLPNLNWNQTQQDIETWQTSNGFKKNTT